MSKMLLLSLNSPPLNFFQLHPRPNFPQIRVSTLLTLYSFSSFSDGLSDEMLTVGKTKTNYDGVKLVKKVAVDQKTRLDSWISLKIEGISRARVQSSIRSGLVSVNGHVVRKVSYVVRTGDEIDCTIAKLQPLRAEAEDIPLDIEYEDEHVLVVNKPPHMVVHPAPGNAHGTLVNAILNHCSLPTVALDDTEWLSEAEDDDNDVKIDIHHTVHVPAEEMLPSIRPGIVHRLDKGTSGLLVVAKDEHSHAHLAEQFKAHTVSRVYLSLTAGVPNTFSSRVEIPIGRDLNNRIRMTAVTGHGHSGPIRHAASRYKVLEVLANGGAAVAEWRLETGRTHQIRVHAKYMGIPLLGDELYGGTKDLALSLLRPRTPVNRHAELTEVVSSIERPCLHAMVLGFKHPCSGKFMHFSCPPPADFAGVLNSLRSLSK